MFEEKMNKRPRASWVSEFSDEELLREYRLEQERQKSFIGGRDHSHPYSAHQEGEMTGKEKEQEAINLRSENQYIEKQFADLDVIRAEIEKRGLKAPTMEERGM